MCRRVPICVCSCFICAFSFPYTCICAFRLCVVWAMTQLPSRPKLENTKKTIVGVLDFGHDTYYKSTWVVTWRATSDEYLYAFNTVAQTVVKYRDVQYMSCPRARHHTVAWFVFFLIWAWMVAVAPPPSIYKHTWKTTNKIKILDSQAFTNKHITIGVFNLWYDM